MVIHISIGSILSISSGVFVFFFYFAVFRDAVRKTITPNPISWLIWSLNDSLILLASLGAGARNTLPVPFVYAVFGWFIVVAAFRNKGRVPNDLEKICLSGALVGWGCYFASLSTLLALIIAVVVNNLGFLPILFRLFKDRRSERIKPWTLVWIGGGLSLASVEQWRVELLFFPVSSFLLSSITILFIIFPRGRHFSNSK